MAMTRAEEVADKLLGSVADLLDYATVEERDDAEFCAALDQLVMLCDGCGWWCETGEMDTAGAHAICEQCQDEQGEPA